MPKHNDIVEDVESTIEDLMDRYEPSIVLGAIARILNNAGEDDASASLQELSQSIDDDSFRGMIGLPIDDEEED